MQYVKAIRPWDAIFGSSVAYGRPEGVDAATFYSYDGQEGDFIEN
jgi:hypothetical protein